MTTLPYNPRAIEVAAQQMWDEQHVFRALEDTTREKFYCLAMLPYPSGKLHMGHVRNYTLSDVIARYQRMLGKNVLQPMGWDAFGLPAENAAIQNATAPAQWTYQNIDYMRAQLKQLGLAIDWQREIATCKPEYYRWEQWFFTQLFAKGLVYKKSAMVNWDPVDNTILANEQVIDGRGWRSNALVERREVPQWFFKITTYADELLNELDALPGWPSEVRTMQQNWIGRSTGAQVFFAVEGQTAPLEIFTTRPDTLFGVTYLAIAAQHPLAQQVAAQQPTVQTFIETCRAVPTAEEAMATLVKRGVATGLHAMHPITGALLPIWVANFVLMDYGTGAVMAVPAHDQRDFEFAQYYYLPVQPVIQPIDGEHDYAHSAYTGGGTLINSAEFNELTLEAAQTALTDYLIKLGKGTRQTHYRLRDWSISRQRYWGTPVPIINCATCGPVAVPADQLPVVLPETVTFTGATSPLKTDPNFYATVCPQCGAAAQRETDTFDTFMESSWYYARNTCPDQTGAMLDARADYWLPVDQYIGGIEHAVMHLLYARFYHKLLRDAGLVHSNEPFTRLLTQGMVLKDGAKMSKSKGNTVDPNAMIEQYGADTVRLAMLFAAPPEQSVDWSDAGIEGAHRFLKRLWQFGSTYQMLAHYQAAVTSISSTALQKARRQLHQILQQAEYDYTRQQFNTVVSGCMKLLNLLLEISNAETAQLISQNTERCQLLLEGFSILLQLLAPITPHITHALWQLWSFDGLSIDAKFPQPDATAMQNTELQLTVQVNGKLRAHLTVPATIDAASLEALAVQHPQVQRYLDNQSIKKIIHVPQKLINIVV